MSLMARAPLGSAESARFEENPQGTRAFSKPPRSKSRKHQCTACRENPFTSRPLWGAAPNGVRLGDNNYWSEPRGYTRSKRANREQSRRHTLGEAGSYGELSGASAPHPPAPASGTPRKITEPDPNRRSAASYSRGFAPIIVVTWKAPDEPHLGQLPIRADLCRASHSMGTEPRNLSENPEPTAPLAYCEYVRRHSTAQHSTTQHSTTQHRRGTLSTVLL